MKITKLSSILLFSFLFIWAFMPDLSAKTSWSFNLNVGPRPYVVCPPPAPAPAPVAVYGGATVVRPYPRYVYPGYSGVVVQQPVQQPVYVQPYYPYWGY